MDIISTLLDLVDLAEKLRSLCQKVQDNKDQCGRLAGHVSSLRKTLQDLQKKTPQGKPQAYMALTLQRDLAELRTCFTDAEELVKKYDRTGSVRRIWKAGAMEKEFEGMFQRLDDIRKRLSLSLQVEQREQGQLVQDTVDRSEQKLDSLHNKVDKLLQSDWNVRGPDAPCSAASQDAAKSSIAQYKTYIQEQFGKVKEYNSLPGSDWVMVSERYTDLVIVQRHREPHRREEEIRGKGTELYSAFARASKHYLCTTVEQFFSPDSKGQVPKAVILQGHSGYGKTFTVHKIMDDWASGKMYKDLFDLVFHFKLKELNNVKENCSLVDLLPCENIDKSTVLHVLQESPQRVLFILDGFDEMRLSAEDLNSSCPLKPEIAESAKTVLLALLKGKMLSKSSLLVTTRSTASRVLSDILKGPQRFTEILGFYATGVENYFQTFFAGEENARVRERALNHVMGTDTLLTACFIPVTCWIVCNVFKDVLQEDTDIPSVLDTTTSIFAHFVFTQRNYHGPSLDDNQWSLLLKSLGKLAMDGVMKQIVLFDECDVDQKMSDNHPFLGKVFQKKVSKVETKYSFMHLSFQEFFAALFHLSDLDVAKKTLQRVQEDLSTADQKLHMSHLLPIVQFLFGLLNHNVIRLHSLSEPPDICFLLEEWICELIRAEEGLSRTHNIQIFILHCLYEAHEAGFVERAMNVWNRINLDGIPLKKTDCSVLAYCVRHCSSLERLILTHCNLTGDKLRVLTEAMGMSEELGLVVEELRDGDVDHLVTALKEGKIVADLKVKNSSLSLKSVLQLLDTLTKQKQVDTVDVNLRVPYENSTTATITTEIDNFTKAATSIDNGEDVCLIEQPQQVETPGLHISLERVISSALYSAEQLRCEHFLKLGLDHPMLCISGVSVSQSASPELFTNDWTSLLRTVHNLADSPEAKQVDVVQSCLLQVPDVKMVELMLSYLTADIATKFLSFSQACKTLQSGRCKLSEGAGGQQESVCSDVSLRKTATSVRLTVKPPAGESLSEITFAMATLSEESDWISVFKKIGAVSGSSGCVDLSFVYAVSGLQSVLLTVTCLTECWATALLSLLQAPSSAPPKYCSVSVLEPPFDTKDSICSFLSVEQDGNNIMLVVEYTKQVLACAEVQITDVSLTLPQTHLASINLHTIRTLGDLHQGTPEFVVQVSQVQGLAKITLIVSSLTGGWADTLHALILKCPTLASITLDAGQAGRGLLLEEGLRVLQDALQSLRKCHSRRQLTITLTGRRCSKKSNPCTAPGDCERRCNRSIQMHSSQLKAFTHTFLEKEREVEVEEEEEKVEVEEEEEKVEVVGEEKVVREVVEEKEKVEEEVVRAEKVEEVVVREVKVEEEVVVREEKLEEEEVVVEREEKVEEEVVREQVVRDEEVVVEEEELVREEKVEEEIERRAVEDSGLMDTYRDEDTDRDEDTGLVDTDRAEDTGLMDTDRDKDTERGCKTVCPCSCGLQ
ncbi:hypothetical protein ACEWY4_001261 [Coilia grayii]|uniref:NACHT domain-containing protein n=1 Tax=Coilia grayii TaxID=363190 RepID=A0ABD1KZ10_9TELE